MVDAALRVLITGDAQLSAAFGSRVRPLVLGQEEEDAAGVTWNFLNDRSDVTHDGPSGEGEARVQFTIRARSLTGPGGLEELRRRMLTVLDCFQGQAAGVELTLFYDDAEDSEIYRLPGRDAPELYRRDVEFDVFYCPLD